MAFSVNLFSLMEVFGREARPRSFRTGFVHFRISDSSLIGNLYYAAPRRFGVALQHSFPRKKEGSLSPENFLVFG